MPQVRVRRQRLVFLGRPDLDELQVRMIDQRLEVLIGRDRNMMPSLAQAQPDPDEGTNVTVGTKGEEKDVHGRSVSRLSRGMAIAPESGVFHLSTRRP